MPADLLRFFEVRAWKDGEIYGRAKQKFSRKDAKTQRRVKCFGRAFAFCVRLRLCVENYLSATGLEVEPPKLLRTVIFSGFVGHDNEALKRPLPVFFRVPTRAPLAVT